MTKRYLLTALLLGLLHATVIAGYGSFPCASSCDAVSCDEQSAGSWWASTDALFLQRTQRFVEPMVVDENAGLAPVLTGRDLDFGTEVGPRMALGRQWVSGRAGELVYFGLHDWTANARVDGNNNLSLPGDLGLATFDFFAADRMDVSYGSRIHNAEANLWNPVGDVQLLTGFRYFSIQEDFGISSFDSDTYLSDYRIDTNNQMYGGQVGLRKSWLFGRLSVAPELKFGLLQNWNNQHSVVRDLGNTNVLRDERVSASMLSSLSEIRLVSGIALTQNISVTTGYNMLWLTGVAQAPYQIDTSYTATSSRFVDDNHSIFFHGMNIGLVISR
jgi:hypothetical protein